MVNFIQLDLLDTAPYYSGSIFFDSLKFYTKDLNFESEDSCPYHVFYWKHQIRGNFSVEKLLLLKGYLKIINPTDIFKDIQTESLILN